LKGIREDAFFCGWNFDIAFINIILLIMLKITLTVASFFLMSYGFSQNEYDSIVIKNIVGEFKPINIELINNKKQLASIETQEGRLKYRSSETAYYTLKLSGRDSYSKIIDSIMVKAGQLLVINLTIEGPCLYNHPSDYIPVCPKNHKNKIIPIAYGLIVYTKKSKHNKGRFYSGGCITTGCDPQFYCKKHKIEF
jgi:hypothetical protein